jgi:hypothetical protein
MRLPLMVNSSCLVILFAIMILYPSWELKSLLFINNPSIKTNSLAVGISNVIYINPRSVWSICHLRRLLRALALSSLGSWCCAATDKSKAASGWQIDAIYAPRARSWTYIYLNSGDSVLISWIFLFWSFWWTCSSLYSVFSDNMQLLNINILSTDSFSFFLVINLAVANSFCSCSAKDALDKMNISSVYILTIPNLFLSVLTNRYGL